MRNTFQKAEENKEPIHIAHWGVTEYFTIFGEKKGTDKQDRLFTVFMADKLEEGDVALYVEAQLVFFSGMLFRMFQIDVDPISVAELVRSVSQDKQINEALTLWIANKKQHYERPKN